MNFIYNLYILEKLQVSELQYKNGYMHGKGIKILNAGCKLEGTWKRNKLHGDNCIFW